MPETIAADPSLRKDCGNSGKYFMSTFIWYRAVLRCHLSHQHNKV